jgi:protein tyrosine phosphatase (PTP) superfamily phosphohydrolase (DUF442 family)
MITRRLLRGLNILWTRLTGQGLWVTALWAVDHAVRTVTGANIRRVSQITPRLHVGGQFRRRGWRELSVRGITAVINMRIEFDDQEAGVAPPRYLYLPTVDDKAPSLEHLQQGVAFIEQEIAQGGGVYVHCGSGVGRAPTMAAAYLVHMGVTPEQAWARIRKVRPFIRPTDLQVAQLERFAAQR